MSKINECSSLNYLAAAGAGETLTYTLPVSNERRVIRFKKLFMFSSGGAASLLMYINGVNFFAASVVNSAITGYMHETIDFDFVLNQGGRYVVSLMSGGITNMGFLITYDEEINHELS